MSFETSTPGTATRTRPATPTPARRRLSGRPRGFVLLAAPVLAVLAAFFLYPVVEILLRSITSPELGLQNYRAFFGRDVYVTVLLRTVGACVLITGIVLLIAYPYAYVMTTAPRRWRLVLLAAVTLPFWISLMVRNYAWIVLLQPGGVVNDMLAAVGIGRVRLIGNWIGVTVGMTHILLPYAVLPLFASMMRVDRRLMLAAESLGAKPRIAFLRVFLPLSMPGVFAATTLVFILSLGFYITPALLGSPQNAFLAQLIFQQASQLLNWGAGGAMAGVLMAAAALLVGLGAFAARRARWDVSDMRLS